MKETKNVKKEDVFSIFVVAKDLSRVVEYQCSRIHGDFAYLYRYNGRRIKLDSRKYKVFTDKNAALNYIEQCTEHIISSALETLYNHQLQLS